MRRFTSESLMLGRIEGANSEANMNSSSSFGPNGTDFAWTTLNFRFLEGCTSYCCVDLTKPATLASVGLILTGDSRVRREDAVQDLPTEVKSACNHVLVCEHTLLFLHLLSRSYNHIQRKEAHLL